MGNSMYFGSSQMKNENHVNSNAHNYSFLRVEDIPIGTPPPSPIEVIRQAKEIALRIDSKLDPTALENCQHCLRGKSVSELKDSETIVRNICRELSHFSLESPPYSEKTIKLKADHMPEIWISSTKNSDHTISYWIQYPIQPYHLQAAILKTMNIPVTQENMQQIVQRYPVLLKQLQGEAFDKMLKCEHVDPIYLEYILLGMFAKGFKRKQ